MTRRSKIDVSDIEYEVIDAETVEEVTKKAPQTPQTPQPIKRKVGRPRIHPLETPEEKAKRIAINKAKRGLKTIALKEKPAPEKRKTHEDKKNYLAKAGLTFYNDVAPDDIPPPDAGGKWSKGREESYLKFLADGGITAVWLRAAGLERHYVRRRLEKDAAFKAKYEKAKEAGIDVMAEEALQIASTPVIMEETVETVMADGSVMVATKKADNVYARKLAFQARLELLKKWAPDRYGDKVSVDVNDRQAAAIMAARQRLLGK